MRQGAATVRAAAARGVREMASSSRGGSSGSIKKKIPSSLLEPGASGHKYNNREQHVGAEARQRPAEQHSGWPGAEQFCMMSFPRFKGEGGVIESNKFYVHPNATNLNAKPIRRPAPAPAPAAGKALKSDAATDALADADVSGVFKGGAPPAVVEARVGFVGNRYSLEATPTASKAGAQPGRHFGKGEGPSVIQLDGMVYIVSRDKS